MKRLNIQSWCFAGRLRAAFLSYIAWKNWITHTLSCRVSLLKSDEIYVLPWSAVTLTLFPFYIAWTSGFPSVHRNHFVYLKHRSCTITLFRAYVVRAHYKLLRLYELATDCSFLWSKGKIRMVYENMVLDGNNSKTRSSIVAQQTTTRKDTINMAR